MPDPSGLRLSGLKVSFSQRNGPAVVAALADRLEVPAGQLLGISGVSGSGKTTLLHALAGLLRPQAGRVLWGEQDLVSLSERQRDRWRRGTVGFVFQDFHLIAEMSARDNVLLPVWFGRWRAAADEINRATRLLAQVGIPDPQRRAGLLSRGEQQRVAIARALLRRPRILFADEPTASLDAATGAVVTTLLTEAAREAGATLIVVSHDPHVLARMEEVRHMEKGVLLP